MSAQSKRRPQYEHGGHRERMKAKLLKNGAGGLSETDLLEVLLFYAVPRIDTRKIAEALIAEFGSVDGILNADRGDISKINGIKDNAEVLFAVIREFIARFGGAKPEVSLLEPERMKKFLTGLYKDITAETVYALYFTGQGVFMGEQLVFRGGISSAKFSLRTVTEGAIRAGGSAVVLAHNHPSGLLVPSSDDIISTNRIAAHLAANEIDLIEHYIVGKDEIVGFYAETLE